ncbi:hypothetical protein [Frigoriglobus tundricola]|uniref:Uncharacterized protein n=1 Tax=Frigoriglobus tundricola TaxID=2774151 RepID=A0A6M5YRY5_9BACT|nr:hypothetical protein [Frigoriglobus tundricola]QJW96669.1 hypothetical protein FTUN_4226 [Frigoriglobus tundricola]
MPHASRTLSRTVLVAWAAGMSLVTAGLMTRHWVPLAQPSAADPDWRARFGPRVAGPNRGTWTAVHVLAEGCPCSDRILTHLRARGPHPGVRERLVRVAEGPGAGLTLPGFDCETVAPAELVAGYGVESVPMMLVLGPDGAPRYAGGYTARKQGFDVRDRYILSELLAGRAVPPLPVYGCPVSSRFARAAPDLP